jgi:putative dimethyl sulfoxide reductase chaperone
MKTYKFLALCFRRPDKTLFETLKTTELFRNALASSSVEELEKEYTRLFSLTVAGGVPPYETEYGHKDVFFKTQRLADIAGFYRAFGLEISDAERVDGIGAELEFMDWLLAKEEFAGKRQNAEAAEICREAQAKFVLDHLGRWAPYFGDQVAKNTLHPFYRLVGEWLSEFILSECRRLQVEPERVTGWDPEPVSVTEFECGLDDEIGETQTPQPLTVTK